MLSVIAGGMSALNHVSVIVDDVTYEWSFVDGQASVQ